MQPDSKFLFSICWFCGFETVRVADQTGRCTCVRPYVDKQRGCIKRKGKGPHKKTKLFRWSDTRPRRLPGKDHHAVPRGACPGTRRPPTLHMHLTTGPVPVGCYDNLVCCAQTGIRTGRLPLSCTVAKGTTGTTSNSRSPVLML